MRHRTCVDLELRLNANLVAGRLVSELRNELVGLNVDVLLAWRCFRRLDVPSEEFFCGLRPLLLQALRIILSLVCLE